MLKALLIASLLSASQSPIYDNTNSGGTEFGPLAPPANCGTSGQALISDGACGVSFGAVGAAGAWNITGNGGTNPTTHFWGTTDNNDAVVRRNNLKRATFGAGNLFLHNGASVPQVLSFYDASDTNSIGFTVPGIIPTTYSLTFPATPGSAAQSLRTDGTGILSWGSTWNFDGNTVADDNQWIGTINTHSFKIKADSQTFMEIGQGGSPFVMYPLGLLANGTDTVDSVFVLNGGSPEYFAENGFLSATGRLNPICNGCVFVGSPNNILFGNYGDTGSITGSTWLELHETFIEVKPIFGGGARPIYFYDSDGSNYTGIRASTTTTSNVIYSLPPSDGSTGYVLTTNGVGGLSWTASGGGGGSNWGIVGNSGLTSGNALGTLDAIDVNLVANNVTVAQLTGTGTPAIKVRPAVQLQFLENPGFGTNTISLKSPATLASDVLLTLPVDDGNSGDVLSTDGTGVLSWIAGGSGGAVTLTGTQTITGAKTFSSNPIVTTNDTALNSQGGNVVYLMSGTVSNSIVGSGVAPISIRVDPSDTPRPITLQANNVVSGSGTGGDTFLSGGDAHPSLGGTAGNISLLGGNGLTTFVGGAVAGNISIAGGSAIGTGGGTPGQVTITGGSSLTSSGAVVISSGFNTNAGGSTAALRLETGSAPAGTAGNIELFPNQGASGGFVDIRTTQINLSSTSTVQFNRGSVANDLISIYGGSGTSSGGNVRVFGQSHATRANEVSLNGIITSVRSQNGTNVFTSTDANGLQVATGTLTGPTSSQFVVSGKSTTNSLKLAARDNSTGTFFLLDGPTGVSSLNSDNFRYNNSASTQIYLSTTDGISFDASTANIQRLQTNLSLTISGGTTLGNPARILLFGDTHPTNPGFLRYRSGLHTFEDAAGSVSFVRINTNGIGIGLTPATGASTLQMFGTATVPTAVAGSGILYVTAAGALRYRGPTTDSIIAIP